MLTDAHWMRLEPLVEACRPKGKTAPKDLRRTISATLAQAAVHVVLNERAFHRYLDRGVIERSVSQALPNRCKIGKAS